MNQQVQNMKPSNFQVHEYNVYGWIDQWWISTWTKLACQKNRAFVVRRIFGILKSVLLVESLHWLSLWYISNWLECLACPNRMGMTRDISTRYKYSNKSRYEYKYKSRHKWNNKRKYKYNYKTIYKSWMLAQCPNRMGMTRDISNRQHLCWDSQIIQIQNWNYQKLYDCSHWEKLQCFSIQPLNTEILEHKYNPKHHQSSLCLYLYFLYSDLYLYLSYSFLYFYLYFESDWSLQVQNQSTINQVFRLFSNRNTWWICI